MAGAPSAAPPWLESYVGQIDSRISARVGKGDHSLERAVAEALSGGKRVRAVLALLWCEAVSGDSSRAIPIAAAYEFAHAAALVQDDIVDGSQFRRGEKSIVKKYGLQSAILASNVLLAYVPREISEYGAMGPNGGVMLGKLFELLGDSYAAAVLGEFLDLEMTQNKNASEGDYEHMIELKTGALIGASSASGAVVGGSGATDKMVDVAYRFGESLGMAYQVQDDLLDIVGDEGVLGKPVFADIKAGKKNLVLIHTARQCSPGERDFLADLPANGAESVREVDLDRARELFSKYGSVDYARKTAIGYVARARGILDALEPGPARSKLSELCDYLTDRKY
jgi:geranylgeranyl diphosphate synthase, type I